MTKEHLLNYAKGLKLLYVEDDEASRKSITGLLKNFFNDVTVAADGLEGLLKYDRSIDLIITDIGMPNMNGIEMLKKIKAENRSVPTLIFSAHENTDYFLETINLGIDGYLLKPLNKTQFIDTLLKTLEKIYLTHELESHKKALEERLLLQLKELEYKDKLLIQQSKLAAMGEMIDVIAHQWKNPLNVIAMKSDLLTQLSSDGLHIELNEVKTCHMGVKKQISHLVTTLDEFRKFFRPNLNISTCNLKNMFDSLQILLKDELIRNQIKLQVKCDAMICVDANESELKHIFINLISNAKDAFKINNIENRTIKIEVSKENTNVKITFQDNAGGIPENIIDKVFEANYTTKSDIGGTGIGLYMSQLIASKYQIDLSVQNDEYGAVFTLLKSL